MAQLFSGVRDLIFGPSLGLLQNVVARAAFAQGLRLLAYNKYDEYLWFKYLL